MISQSVSKKIEQTLCGKYGLLLTTKTGIVWTSAGAILDVARAFGAMLPSGDEFNHNFATTLGTVVCLPDAELTAEEYVPLLVHEATHAKQFTSDPVRFVVQYLRFPEARAKHEAEAYAQQAAIVWLLTGELPQRVEDMASALVYGYALSAEDCALAWGLLEQYATSIANGVLPEGPCWVAARILATTAPDACNARALELVKQNCPKALQ